jgi:hypothetical protein
LTRKLCALYRDFASAQKILNEVSVMAAHLQAPQKPIPRSKLAKEYNLFIVNI